MNYGRIAKEYDNHYKSKQCEAENACIAKLLHSEPLGNVLDVGCGTGLSLDLAGDVINWTKYLGIDVSAEMLKVARKKHKGYFFLECEADHFYPDEEEYDTALCLFSIPYIGKHAADAIYGCLRPGWQVICVCYDEPYLNPSSVYGKHKWKYLLTVAWKVRKVLNRFDSLFKKVSETSLAGEHAYKVIVYRKEVQA